MTNSCRDGWGFALLLLAALIGCERAVPLETQVSRLLAERQYDRALSLVTEELGRQPAAWPLQDLQVRVLLVAGRSEEALAAYAARWPRGGPDSPALFRGVAVALAEAALSSPEGLLRSRAAEALATLASPELLPVMERAMATQDPSIRALLVRGLRHIPGQGAGQLALAALDDPSVPVRVAAAVAMAGRTDAQARQALKKALGDPSLAVRLRAAAALAGQQDAAAIQMLRQTLASREGTLRMEAAEVLGQLGDRDSVSDLRPLLSDRDRYVRVYAGEALARLGDPRGRQALREGLRDRDRSVALYAAEAFSNLGDADGKPLLQETLHSATDLSVRLYAAWTLARLGDTGGVPFLEELLQHGELEARVEAAWTLGQVPGSAGMVSLGRAAADPARPVRLQAAWALARRLDQVRANRGGSG